jgi:hypothetical protein
MLNKMLPNHILLKISAAAVGGLLAVLILASLASQTLLQATRFPARSGYYAVFLTSGQVYFGSISREDEHRLVLNDVYYIQPKSGVAASPTSSDTDAALVKLGNEFHSPEDMMEINRAQVLFVEQLKTDGKVAKAMAASK